MSEDRALTCREVVELVTEYLEGTMAPERRVRFEEHLAVCEGCTRYVAQIRETIRLTGLLTEEAIPADEREELLVAFRGWRG